MPEPEPNTPHTQFSERLAEAVATYAKAAGLSTNHTAIAETGMALFMRFLRTEISPKQFVDGVLERARELEVPPPEPRDLERIAGWFRRMAQGFDDIGLELLSASGATAPTTAEVIAQLERYTGQEMSPDHLRAQAEEHERYARGLRDVANARSQ